MVIGCRSQHGPPIGPPHPSLLDRQLETKPHAAPPFKQQSERSSTCCQAPHTHTSNTPHTHTSHTPPHTDTHNTHPHTHTHTHTSNTPPPTHTHTHHTLPHTHTHTSNTTYS